MNIFNMWLDKNTVLLKTSTFNLFSRVCLFIKVYEENSAAYKYIEENRRLFYDPFR